MPTLLMTGAAGYIGWYLLPTFRERYTLRLVDNRDVDGFGRPVEGLDVRDVSDINRMEEYRDLFRGVDAVVHLAHLRPTGPSLHERYLAERGDVDMAYIVYQLALEEGVKRVVVASSNHAADFYERPLRTGELEMVYPTSDQRPLADNFYGWAKEAYEHLGFVFATGAERDGRPLENVQVRIGAPREIRASTFFPDGPGSAGDAMRYRRDLGAYISPRDLTQLFVKSIEAPSIEDEHGIPFQVFYGLSGNARAFWSLVNARRVIGYAPEDDAEIKFADEIREYLLGPGRAESGS